MALKKSVVRDELQRLAEEHGYLTPRIVVEEAKSETNPLHDSFEWDNEAAAERYRIWQARQLIANVKIEIKGKPVDAFHNIRITYEDDSSDNRYYSVQTVISIEDMRRQLLRQALNEISYWQEKYREIEELTKVIDNEKLYLIAERAGITL